MSNKVVTGNEAREAVMRGVMTVAAAVQSTLGPKGRNVLLCRAFGPPLATRDGERVRIRREAAELEEKRAERLKDRQAYRQTLIQRRNDIDVKIHSVEEQIHKLKAGKEANDETADGAGA